MASVARSLSRTALRRPIAVSSPLVGSGRCAQSTRVGGGSSGTRFALQQSQRPSFSRGYADAAPTPKSSGNKAVYWGVGLLAAAGAGYYIYTANNGQGLQESVKKGSAPGVKAGVFSPTRDDYQKVYDEIARRLDENDEYDDGSYGPVLVRLAWHASGTYDKETGTGGSNGATMRFAPENDHGANSGLRKAQEFLEPVKQKFPWISYSDLWTLAGVCAFQEMQGPIIPWRPGRQDRDAAACTPDGRLPDATKEQSHLRAIFYRMGFDDREIVALSGAHALGRCHTDRSGFTGPWTFSPTVLTNDYYKLLLDEKWHWKKWDGPKQYEDDKTKSLMMLPTDMALIKDKVFRKHVERYAKDVDVFFNEFRDVIVKLFELGVPFTSSEEDRMTFKPSNA